MTRLLSRLIDDAAFGAPETPAIRCDGVTLTYGELARRANGLARILVATGLCRGDRVAVWLSKSQAVPVSFYGVLAAGGTLVPIDPRSPSEQAVNILRATGATHLISEPERGPAVAGALAVCPDIRHVIGLETEAAMRVPHVNWKTTLEEASDRPPDVQLSELDAAYILHTSGSTGLPKLILHSHCSAMSFVDWAASEYGLTSDDNLTNHSSHHTCFATFDYYAAARAGATTVILTPEVLMMPSSLTAHLERERVSVWYSVPAALVQLSLRGNVDAHNLGALRWVLFAGETFPGRHLRRIRQQLPSVRFSHVYGSTEVNVCTYFHLPADGDAIGALPIGRPCATARTLVVDEGLQPVADGETGELLVRGSTVMSGYWRDPVRNRQVLVRRQGPGDTEEVYFRTGDRTRVDADGNLAFVARDDRQVKIRGHRVELEEVEGALVSLTSVDEGAVFTLPDDEGSSALHAVVVAAPDAPATEREILAALRKILPPHALPTCVTFVDALPRTPTGKVDGRALRAGAAARVGADGRQ